MRRLPNPIWMHQKRNRSGRISGHHPTKVRSLGCARGVPSAQFGEVLGLGDRAHKSGLTGLILLPFAERVRGLRNARVTGSSPVGGTTFPEPFSLGKRQPTRRKGLKAG